MNEFNDFFDDNVFANVGRLQNYPPIPLLAGILLLMLMTKNVIDKRVHVNAPVVGHRRAWEPQWLVRFRFVRGSRAILCNGYEKVEHLEGRSIRHTN